MVDGWNPQTRLFHEEFLDPVIRSGCLNGSEITRTCDACDLPHSIFQLRLYFFLVQLPFSLQLVEPISTELPELLLEGHLR